MYTVTVATYSPLLSSDQILKLNRSSRPVEHEIRHFSHTLYTVHDNTYTMSFMTSPGVSVALIVFRPVKVLTWVIGQQ